MALKLEQNIIALKKHFRTRGCFATKEVFQFFGDRYGPLSKTAVHWKIHAPKKRGIITSIGKGVYCLSGDRKTKETFQPKILRSHKAYFSKIKKQFPFAHICIWPVRCVHEFMTHLPSIDWTVIEVEKEVSESVYNFLREKKHDIYLNPDVKMMEQSLAYDRQAIIIKNLISQSPLIQHDTVSYPSIEKIIVDLFVDTVIFDVYQGQEFVHIIQGVFNKYQINKQRLKRYATRRNVWEKIQKFIINHEDGESK